MEGRHKSTSSPLTTIAKNDLLDLNAEKLVSVPKVAIEIEGGKRKHTVPNEFILKVRSSSGYSKHLKVIARKGGGRWFISLVTEKDILRQYHYDYAGHGNPDGTVVGRSHKHFPTQKYPLRESHKDIDTWAYDPGPFPQDFVSAVKDFCKECNITIQGLQERLPARWFS